VGPSTMRDMRPCACLQHLGPQRHDPNEGTINDALWTMVNLYRNGV